MGLGVAVRQASFEDAAQFLGEALTVGSVYRLLAEEGLALFPDDYFADLFKDSPKGRPTVPARTMATVLVLQSFEGLSDREACDRLAYDLRWKAAAGLTVQTGSFHPTVLVGIRNRLRGSGRPRRLFEDVNAVARRAGVLRRRVRVLDSTPLLDAVATQDTVTQLRAAIRKLLSGLGRDGQGELAVRVRSALARDDDYATIGKPPCDWDDPAAREQLVDALVRDAHAALAAVDGEQLGAGGAEAAALLALVAGQDVAPGVDGVFRIARRVSRDRVISTVDPQARHGHKSRARRFDGYKTHLSVDPDSELIANVAVTAANTADRDAVDGLLAESQHDDQPDPASDGPAQPGPVQPGPAQDEPGEPSGVTVIGDSAYADGATLARLAEAGHTVIAKVPPARNGTGGFSKDQFRIDLVAGTVTCPAARTTVIRPAARGGGQARFGQLCDGCPLRDRCTSSSTGRVITIHPHEAALQAGKTAQAEPTWQQAYRDGRPRVERKIAHFVRRPWGGRKARARGLDRITTDVFTRAGVLNLATLARLGLHSTPTGWATA